MNRTLAAVDNSSPVDSRSSAIALIDEGNALEEQGRTAEAMARYEAALQADPRCARAHLNRGNVLFAGGQIDEARSAYELALVCDPHYAAAHFNLGNLNSRVREYERALHNYQAAIGIKPDFANAHVAIGNALDSLGRTAEARESYERALAINPGDAGIHFNLGVLAIAEGRHEQAAESLRRAVEIRPDYIESHYTLARVLVGLGHLDAAEASLRRALSIAPESEATLCDLAMLLLVRSKAPEAVQLLMRQLERAPTWAIKRAFANCVARTRFITSDSLIRAALAVAISEPWGTPYELCRPALSLIMLDPGIAGCVRLVNEGWPTRVPKAALFSANVLTTLAADPLLRALLEAAPVSSSIEFERFLTAARHALLETATGEQPSEPSDIAALPFYAALARQCFINEYIFDCNDSERAAAANCRTKLLMLLDANAVIPAVLLLAVAAYFPLYTLPEPGRLLATNQQGPVEAVLRQQVREPLEEQALRTGVKCLTSIAQGVSEKVRDQYEQNPYPRWVKLPRDPPTLHFNRELRRTLPLAPFTPLRDDGQPEVLIAGCGTGSQPVLVAQRFRGVRVLAVDLSLSSISYAMRKTQELGITNIEYAQADILQLGDTTRMFDVVASVGVLHHLADPFMGWRTLLSRLRPGGFMHLGFYSQLARRYVVKAREFIAANGYASTPDDIRRFRRDLTARNSDELEWLSKLPDFYSTSDCRDLLFHVQEHRLTLDQIQSFLSESGLLFLGFELDPGVLHQYRRRFAGDPAAINLHNWARFEADNPSTFLGMYVFWIQKPINHY